MHTIRILNHESVNIRETRNGEANQIGEKKNVIRKHFGLIESE